MVSGHDIRGGLGRYGVLPSTIVRQPARNADDWVICPECGSPVGGNKGTHPVAHPEFIDDRLDEDYDGDLLVRGWRCDLHQYEVVIPARCNGPDAPTFRDGWVGVEIAFADETPRHVATPRRELEDRGLER